MHKYGGAAGNVYENKAASSLHQRSNSNSVKNLNSVNEMLAKNNNKYLRYISKPSISMHKDPFVGYDKLDHKQPFHQDKHADLASSSKRLAEL
jgi:hypothetical protein